MDKKSQNVGILTYHFLRNYGATLQAMCLTRSIRQMGYRCELVDYRAQKRVSLKQRLGRQLRKMTGRLKTRDMIDSLRAGDLLSARSYGRRELGQLGDTYDTLIVGSDEIWNFGNVYGDQPAYMLDFPFEGKRISYAPSLGSFRPDGRGWDTIRRRLAKFDHVSVRDPSTRELLKSQAGIDSLQVGDPTVLEPWRERRAEPEKGRVVVTGHLKSRQVAAVVEFCRAHGLQPVSVGYEYAGIECADKDPGPDEWVAALQRAELVVSSLFHASIITMLSGGSFAVFALPGKHSKLTDFVNQYGVQPALLPDDADARAISAAYEARPQASAENIRFWVDGSRQFLQESLEH